MFNINMDGVRPPRAMAKLIKYCPREALWLAGFRCDAAERVLLNGMAWAVLSRRIAAGCLAGNPERRLGYYSKARGIEGWPEAAVQACADFCAWAGAAMWGGEGEADVKGVLEKAARLHDAIPGMARPMRDALMDRDAVRRSLAAARARDPGGLYVHPLYDPGNPFRLLAAWNTEQERIGGCEDFTLEFFEA